MFEDEEVVYDSSGNKINSDDSLTWTREDIPPYTWVENHHQHHGPAYSGA
jgi:hypothetical protein